MQGVVIGAFSVKNMSHIAYLVDEGRGYGTVNLLELWSLAKNIECEFYHDFADRIANAPRFHHKVMRLSRFYLAAQQGYHWHTRDLRMRLSPNSMPKAANDQASQKRRGETKGMIWHHFMPQRTQQILAAAA